MTIVRSPQCLLAAIQKTEAAQNAASSRSSWHGRGRWQDLRHAPRRPTRPARGPRRRRRLCRNPRAQGNRRPAGRPAGHPAPQSGIPRRHIGGNGSGRLLARHPQLALVDELAHTNIPGSRHAKRYQDVIELLDAGIDVFTTMNVQHAESRVDTVRQITGSTVHETVPDSVLDGAEIELIDLPPEELLKRLDEGKVYLPERAELAMMNFFREGN